MRNNRHATAIAGDTTIIAVPTTKSVVATTKPGTVPTNTLAATTTRVTSLAGVVMFPMNRVVRAALIAAGVGTAATPAAAQWTAQLLPNAAPYSRALGIQNGVVYGNLTAITSPTLWDVYTLEATSMMPTTAGEGPLPSGQTENRILAAYIFGAGDGQYLGLLRMSGLVGPVVWKGGANSFLLLNNSNRATGVAFDAEGSWQVGWYGSGSIQTERPSLWMTRATPRVDLLPLDATGGIAYAIDQGVVSGEVYASQTVWAALWPNPLTQPQTWINLNPPVATYSRVRAARGGVQVGKAQVPTRGSETASLWRGSADSWVDLGALLPGHSDAQATDGVWQVGNWAGSAMVWRGTAASWQSLNEFSPPGLPQEMTWSTATGVWSDGVTLFVCGYGGTAEYLSEHAILWSRPLCVPPTVVTQPQPVTFCSAQALTLSVAVDAADATYQWYRNGVVLYWPPSAREATLSIPFAWVTDAGEYTCEVRTDCGGVVTQPVTVRYVQFCCNDIDFNNNDVFPEDQDVIDFFAVFAGGTDCPACDPIDFNNNGVFPEDQDVIDFFNVLAGGTCP